MGVQKDRIQYLIIFFIYNFILNEIKKKFNKILIYLTYTIKTIRIPLKKY